jgi:hydrogenase nickel incorporation protein HypA/HybF
MHELSLSQAILDTALRHAGGQKVTSIDLRIGRLRQVVPDSLEFYFELVALETACEGATLEIELVPATLRCRQCEVEWQLEQPPFRCPSCQGGDVDIVAGDELEVESLTVEEEACTAPR